MPRSGVVNIPPGTVTEVTDGAVSSEITLQLMSGHARILGTSSGTAPSVGDFKGGLLIERGEGPPFGSTLDSMFPGAGYTRLWALSVGGAEFTVFHA